MYKINILKWNKINIFVLMAFYILKYGNPKYVQMCRWFSLFSVQNTVFIPKCASSTILCQDVQFYIWLCIQFSLKSLYVFPSKYSFYLQMCIFYNSTFLGKWHNWLQATDTTPSDKWYSSGKCAPASEIWPWETEYRILYPHGQWNTRYCIYPPWNELLYL